MKKSLILVFVVSALEHKKKMFSKEQGQTGYRVLVADGCIKTVQKSVASIQMDKRFLSYLCLLLAYR